MKFTFRNKKIDKERLCRWLRIVLTRIFGSQVYVMGSEQPMKILPWIWNGRILLMGAEHRYLQADFTNEYTLRLRQSPPVSCPPDPGAERQTAGCVVLGHQLPGEMEAIIGHVEAMSPGVPVLLAYGGKVEVFSRIDWPDKAFISCPSLRGPSYMMGHHEILEAAITHSGFADAGVEYIAFIESDLLPLRRGWLDGALEAMVHHDADFGAKEIRDVTYGNCFFHANAVERGVVGPGCGDDTLATRVYHHALGCFYIVRRTLLTAMLAECRKMEGLYFEVMFPSAAHAAGGKLLSVGHVCDALREVRYRPFHELHNLELLIESNRPMAHPVKGSTILEAIQLIRDKV